MRAKRLGDGDASGTLAGEGLDGEDLEVVRVAEAVLGPEGEVVANGDRAGLALAGADGPVSVVR